jgi:hypothetical protein
MQQHTTAFDINRHHIHLELIVADANDMLHSVAAILDTGAPGTEFSDQFLTYAGFLDTADENVSIKPGLQTQKYGIIELPWVVICGHRISNFEVFVSHFEPSWGIDASIGLDFFRRFLMTIDYANGRLITSPYKIR